jgi:hypothetical protein
VALKSLARRRRFLINWLASLLIDSARFDPVFCSGPAAHNPPRPATWAGAGWETDPMESTAEQRETVEAWLTRGVAGIGTASLLADVGHEIPTALLPSFLTSTLGTPASALGAIEGVSDALAGAARIGGGALADEPDRRRLRP